MWPGWSGRSAPAFYYNMVGGRDQAPAFAEALIRTASPAATDALLAALQADLPPAFPQARLVIRGLTQGPPVNAPVELRLVGQDIDVLRATGDDLRARLARVSSVAMVRTGIAGGAPKLTLQVDEARARLLGLDLGQIARQMEAGLEGVTGGSLLEGTEELPVRVRLGAGLRGDPVAIGDMPILPPGAAQLAAAGFYPAVPLSTLGALRLEPSESTITRRNGERVNTVQAFLMPGVLPAVALAEAVALLEAEGYSPPEGILLETGGDSDARNSTVQALIAPLGLIVTLSIAVVVMTFNSFRLTLIAFAVAGLSAGLSMLALAVFNYPVRDHRDHRCDRVHRRVDQRGADRAVGSARRSARRARRPRGHGRCGGGLGPAHHLDHHHDGGRLPAADPWGRRVLAAIRDVGRGGRGAVGDAGLCLYTADVRPDPVAAKAGDRSRGRDRHWSNPAPVCRGTTRNDMKRATR